METGKYTDSDPRFLNSKIIDNGSDKRSKTRKLVRGDTLRCNYSSCVTSLTFLTESNTFDCRTELSYFVGNSTLFEDKISRELSPISVVSIVKYIIHFAGKPIFFAFPLGLMLVKKISGFFSRSRYIVQGSQTRN